ncbi:MAG: flagellar hook-length control protein FliK [Candidatus Aquilonibacter sp.]
MISNASVLPANLINAAAGTAHAGGKGKGAHWASLFGASLVNASTASSSTSPTASPLTANANLLAQLTSLLQNGTPMATIVDQLAQSVGSSAAQLLAGKMSSSDLDRLRNSITQTLANALSPPSNAPPGTAAQQAAALAARLQSVVESIAGDAQNGSGQQNELSGNLLDANSAKELPAQLGQSNGTSSPLDVSSLVSSLLSSVIAALNAPSATAPPVPAAKPSYSPVQLASTQSLATSAAEAQQSAPSTLSAGLLNQSTANAVAPQAPTSPQTLISMSNAPDLLARMLVRAAGVDAQLNAGGTPASASDASTGASALAAPASTPSLSSSTLAARFAALLADADGTAITAGSSSGNAWTSTNSGHSFAQDLAQQAPSGTNAASLIAAPNTSLNAQVQNALQSTPAGTSVDANAVLEQMINGMSMRTLAQGTSEIRLQLQPENLGQVTMRLTVSGTQVTANVVAQSADVRSALVANQQDLARSLSEAGLTLSGFSVDVSGGDAGQDQSKDRTAGFGRRYTVHELGGQPTAETTEASNLEPSLLGGSNLELFNSLA